jgi:rhamnulokinase
MTDPCKTYLAIDLGASSGRVMAGRYQGRKLTIEEVHRFPNSGVETGDGWHWDFEGLFQSIVEGLGMAAKRYGSEVVSVAVDTWGVDYGLIDEDGNLAGQPWMYRDERTNGMIDEADRVVGKKALWERTGIQPMFFNTVFQLMAENRKTPEALEKATTLLFMPDLLNFRLSGVRAIERTIASTSGLLRAGTAEWDVDLAEKLGIPSRVLAPVTEPCVVLGPLSEEIASQTSLSGVMVSTCGSHDTASAVAGVPASAPNPLFLSSGTWSLLGRELDAADVSVGAMEASFSNEQGLNGTTRFLKNISGMWLLQECKRVWDEAGSGMDYSAMVDAARGAECVAWIDPDAAEFARSCDMPEVIGAWIEKSGQRRPTSQAQLVRTILESLALKYRKTLEGLKALQSGLPDTLHVVGGGCRNSLLNQMTADATGLRVVAGPVEATACGNVIAQMLARGDISSLAEGRSILAESFDPEIFEPTDPAPWDAKAKAFDQLVK